MKVVDWLAGLSDWPPRSLLAFIWWVCIARGVVVVFSFATGADIHGPDVLVGCFLFVLLMHLMGPRRSP